MHYCSNMIYCLNRTLRLFPCCTLCWKGKRNGRLPGPSTPSTSWTRIATLRKILRSCHLLQVKHSPQSVDKPGVKWLMHQFYTLKCVYRSQGVLLHLWKSIINLFCCTREAECCLINGLQWCHKAVTFCLFTGKRACVGESLARMELFIFLVSLLQHFTFSCTEGPDSINLIPAFSGFANVPRSYQIIATPRWKEELHSDTLMFEVFIRMITQHMLLWWSNVCFTACYLADSSQTKCFLFCPTPIIRIRIRNI